MRARCWITLGASIAWAVPAVAGDRTVVVEHFTNFQ
jgi:hypothetical protein